MKKKMFSLAKVNVSKCNEWINKAVKKNRHVDVSISLLSFIPTFENYSSINFMTSLNVGWSPHLLNGFHKIIFVVDEFLK